MTPQRTPVLTLVSLGALLFVAGMIAVLGAVSFVTDDDVIPRGASGAVPFVAGAGALVAWIGVLAPRLATKPGLARGVLAGVAAGAGYVLGAFLAVLPAGIALAAATAMHLLTGWFALAVTGVGVLVATGVLVLARVGGGGSGARWPWEQEPTDRDEDEPGQ